MKSGPDSPVSPLKHACEGAETSITRNQNRFAIRVGLIIEFRGKYAFGSYRGNFSFLDRITHKGQQTPVRGQPTRRRATARVLPGGARRAAAGCFCQHRRRGYLARGMSWVAGVDPKPHAGSRDGDTAIELLSEVVTCSILVWFARQRWMKNSWVCDGLVFF